MMLMPSFTFPSLWSVGCRGGDAPWQPFIQADFVALNLSLMGDGIVRGLLVLRQRLARSPAAPLRPVARWIHLGADSSE